MINLLYLLLFFSLPIQIFQYESIRDFYDTEYQYDYTENDINVSEEIGVMKTPVFISRPLRIIENEGSTLRLPCVVDCLEGFVLLWRKNGTILAVGDQVINKFEERIHLDQKSGGNYLVIKQANPADEAEYVCSVSAFKKTEIKHEVRVRVKPVIVTNPRQTLVVKEGHRTELSCQAVAGSPPPKLRWRRLLDPLPTGEQSFNGGLLKFEAVQRTYTGNYVCEADNGFDDSPVTSLVRIEVEYGPTVNLTKTEDSSAEMTINCTVDSHPPSHITWLKEGVELDTEDMNIIVSEQENKQILTLVDLNDATFGNYSCIAENKFGMDADATQIAGKPIMGDLYKNIKRNSSKLQKKSVGSATQQEISHLLRGSFSKSQALSKVLLLMEDDEASQDMKEESVIQFLRFKWNKPKQIFDDHDKKAKQSINHKKKKNLEKGISENVKRILSLIYFSRPAETIYFARTPGYYTYSTEDEKIYVLKYAKTDKPTTPKRDIQSDFLKLLRVYSFDHETKQTPIKTLEMFDDSLEMFPLLRSSYTYNDDLDDMDKATTKFPSKNVNNIKHESFLKTFDSHGNREPVPSVTGSINQKKNVMKNLGNKNIEESLQKELIYRGPFVYQENLGNDQKHTFGTDNRVNGEQKSENNNLISKTHFFPKNEMMTEDPKDVDNNSSGQVYRGIFSYESMLEQLGKENKIKNIRSSETKTKYKLNKSKFQNMGLHPLRSLKRKLSDQH